MEKKFIEGYEYNCLLEKIRYGVNEVRDAIEIFEFLKDKKTEIRTGFDDKQILENPHLAFIDGLFFKSMSDRTCGYTDAEEEFLKSSYLSEELKKEIWNRIKNCSKELIELLNSEKEINDFSMKEIKEIVELIKSTSNSLSSKDKDEYRWFCFIFEEYLFVLDGNGPVEYIKEKFGEKLPIAMLERSNVICRASYYSGYGVDHNLLGDRHLFSLYKKFVKFYPEKVEEFVKMVMSVSMLTATEFINDYESFVWNGLNSDFKSKEGNVSVDDVYGSARDLVGAFSMFTLLNREQSDLDRRFELESHRSILKRFVEKIEQFKNLQESEQLKVNNKNESKILERKREQD